MPTGVATVLDVLRSDHTEQAKASGERKKASKKSKGKAGDAMDVAEVSEDGRYLLVRVLAAGECLPEEKKRLLICNRYHS